MITVAELDQDKITGYLGNKMFMVANAYAVAKKAGDMLVLPPWEFQNTFAVKIPTSKSLVYDYIYTEPFFPYAPVPPKQSMNLVGYFQSNKYWLDCESEILSMFQPNKELEEAIDQKWGKILQQNVVGLHVRRGDYVQLADHHPVLGLDYYERALSHFKDFDAVLICSNDMAWCRENFVGDKVLYSDSFQEKSEGSGSAAFDLFLLSKCKHQIIANSSYSWWAAYLNPNPNKKVVAPQVWFGQKKLEAGFHSHDLIPPSWILE